MFHLKLGKAGGASVTRRNIKDYTILLPMMLPIHFELIRQIITDAGYRVEMMTNSGPGVVEEGLKYVHNDACYPAILVIGQVIESLKSGRYDTRHTAVAITQTGGGCRASNYIFLLRKALKRAGFPEVPVISLSFDLLKPSSPIPLTPGLLMRLAAAVLYGDYLMLLYNQTRSYEREPGVSKRVLDSWIDRLCREFRHSSLLGKAALGRTMAAIAADFAGVPAERTPKVKVGIVGEIYVKYAAFANNHLEDFLVSQDCEVMVPGLMGFIQYCIVNKLEDYKLYGGSRAFCALVKLVLRWLRRFEDAVTEALKAYPGYTPSTPFQEVVEMGRGVIGYGTKMGEGWLLTAEMTELIHKGYGNIICAQPFGCLPNHICGKGMIRELRRRHPSANIVAIDYDPGATSVNQENRIKLMLAVAREALSGTSQAAQPPEPLADAQ